jgi:endoglucanase
MGRGINLGIYFEDSSNPFAFNRMENVLRMYWSSGFRNLRIPVTWYTGTDINHLVNKMNDTDFMAKLDYTISLAINIGFYVVINTHHELWLKEKYDGSQIFHDKFYSLWVNIAQRYKKYDQKLIFEVLNEPGIAFGDFQDGHIKPQSVVAIERTRKINKVGYYAIRSVSPNRIIAISPNGLSCLYMAPLIYPTKDFLPGEGNDLYLMITLHSYTDWNFCSPAISNDSFYGSGIGSIVNMKNDFNKKVDDILKWKSKFPLKSLVLYIGEFGVGRYNEKDRYTDLILSYYSHVPQKLIENGIPVSVWCDRGQFNITKFDKNGYSYLTQHGRRVLGI